MSRRFFDPETSEFIRISNGREYVRKFEVVGLRWEQYLSEDEEGKNALLWRLKVFYSEAAHMIAYAEDAIAIMESFGLPTEPPEV